MKSDQPPSDSAANIYQSDVSLLFAVPRKDVQSGDLSTVLPALQRFLTSREVVVAGRGRVSLFFQGYEVDSREVFEIPEIRRYVKALDAKFPYWFYFADPQSGVLKVLAFCLCRVEKVAGGVKPNHEDLQQFLLSHTADLNKLCETFSLGQQVCKMASEEALACFIPSNGSSPAGQ